MTRVILLSLATAVVLCDGYVFGRWTNRWGNPQALNQAVAALERVPMTIGDWHAKPRELGAKQAQAAGYDGYWLRRYERRGDGAAINVMLACGRPGPLSVHTPDICYAGAGFVQSEPAEPFVVGADTDRPAAFLMTKFRKPDALVPVSLRIYWTWRAAKTWKTPANPRMELAGQPVVYKMYVTHELTGVNESRDDSICAEFINVLLPELDRSLARSP
jgi:hypothetical protein